MSLIACDISEFQPVVNDTYPHRWLTFRVSNEFGRLDNNAAANLAWCQSALQRGKLDGFAGYVNPVHVPMSEHLANLDQIRFPKTATVMIDAEPWPQQDGTRLIVGDHSAAFNAAADSLAARQDDRSRVWGYSYLSAFAEIWPTRPSWLGLVVASYGGQQPVSPGPGPLVGWQYTDGQYSEPGLPSSSQPFGACDHNLILAEVDMPLTDADVAKVADAVWAKLRPVFTDDKGAQYRVETLVGEALGKVLNPSALAAAIAKQLPDIQPAQVQSAVEAGVRQVLGSLDNTPQ